ncbi:MAG: ABC transporter permease [Gammaproteobacteria bacterium]|nr:ABC transporter permease [Gammaproteobacteria bacterium]
MSGFFSLRRFGAVIRARNLEFLRDRSSLGWNILFPLILIVGFALAQSDEERPQFKVGVAGVVPAGETFFQTRYVQFIPVAQLESAIDKVRRHELDMVFDLNSAPRYWVNDSSQSGYILEQMLSGRGYAKAEVTGEPVSYVDWVVAGVLGVNMMFSCLFGVGYTIVRYRKNGVLKRLKATPLGALEFLTAQVVSRLVLITVATSGVFVGCSLLVGFTVLGSYWNLLLVLIVGAVALISLGLVVAARLASEELASGLLNLITWPMMLLSGAWFSMEGTTPLFQWLSSALPLTHIVSSARAVMIEGAGFWQIAPSLGVLIAMSGLFLLVGALSFRWE